MGSLEETPRSVFGALALLCLWVGSILMLFASNNTHWRIVEHNRETAKTIHEGLWYRCVSFLGSALLDFQCTEIRNVLISDSMRGLKTVNRAIQWIPYVRFLVFLSIILNILTATVLSKMLVRRRNLVIFEVFRVKFSVKNRDITM